MGIVHPLMYENEDSLVGQLGYGTGSLHNSDRHAMTWCRNFDGGRSFTTALGHNWQFTTEKWWRDDDAQRGPVDGRAGVRNCVTFNEVKDLLDKAAADGNVTAAGNTALSAALDSADTAYRADDFAAAAGPPGSSSPRPSASPTSVPTAAPRCSQLQSKGAELVGLDERQRGGAARRRRSPRTSTGGPVGGTVPATLSLTLGTPAAFGAFTPGVAETTWRPRRPTVISTAGDARLTSPTPTTTTTGRSSTARSRCRSRCRRRRPARRDGRAFAPVGGSSAPTSLLTYGRPDVQRGRRRSRSSRRSVPNDALRTGTYSKALTFTLSTTTP